MEAVRRAILGALGLAACGPSEVTSPGEQATESTGDETVTSGGDASSSETVTAGTVSASTSSSSTGDDPGRDGAWACGDPIPPEFTGPPCEDPVAPVQSDGTPTGFETCGDGRVHRVEARECVVSPMATDACRNDADCGDGQLCYCDGDDSRCVDAHCSTDADCGGLPCMRGEDPRICTGPGEVYDYFACVTPHDTCDPQVYGTCNLDLCDVCAWTPEDCAWACRPLDATSCITCGRPYLVDGTARVADAVRRGDWVGPIASAHDRLDAEDDARVASHWLRAALAEHASIAAFARYTLDLLALGAPAALVADAGAAMADEIEHARACFAIAARHGAPAHGPGPLPSDGALGDRTALRILDDVVREGCIGETLAALEAAAALRDATDPAVRIALTRIAGDELRHAELAWRHLRWALGEADDRGRASIEALVTAAIADAIADAIAQTEITSATDDPAVPSHGVLGTEARAHVHRTGLAAVIGPCTTTLFAACGSPHAVAS